MSDHPSANRGAALPRGAHVAGGAGAAHVAGAAGAAHVGGPANVAGRFLPIRFHARGGLGEVLVAQDTELKRAVALKRILGEAAVDPEARRRFVLEAEITGRLEHPGVVPVYGLGVDPLTGQPCYAMRFISGKSLKSAIDGFHAGSAGFESLAFRMLLGSFVSVCQTLGFAHSKGVIHRDVKPANVMVGSHGETLVLDWGLAKVLGDPATVARPRGPRPERDSGLGSASGTVTIEGAGTPGYMAPEQATGDAEQLGPAADVYGLGATLYHLLTGQEPLADKPAHARTMLMLQGKVPTAERVEPSVPSALSAVCATAMAARSSQRYRSAEELAADVERWLADEPVSCVAESRVTVAKRWIRRHPTAVATSLAVVFLLGVGAAGTAGLFNAQRSALADLTAEIAAERDRANSEHDRALAAEAAAAANFAESQKVVRECLGLAKSHPVFQRPEMHEPRELLLRTAAAFQDRFAAISDSTIVREDAVLAKFEAAVESAKSRAAPQAIELYRQNIAELEKLVADRPDSAQYRLMLARCRFNLGGLLQNVNETAAAEREFHAAMDLYAALLGQMPRSGRLRFELAGCHNSLALLLMDRGDAPGATRRSAAPEISRRSSWRRIPAPKRPPTRWP